MNKIYLQKFHIFHVFVKIVILICYIYRLLLLRK